MHLYCAESLYNSISMREAREDENAALTQYIIIIN